jgi:outer membrane protein assembly factor BamB
MHPRSWMIVFFLVGSSCNDRGIVAGEDDMQDEEACIQPDCPCEGHPDCPPGTTCVDGVCLPTCGNGRVDPGEQCDDADDGGAVCNEFCLIPGSPTATLTAPIEIVQDIAVGADGTIAAVGTNGRSPWVQWIVRLGNSLTPVWEHRLERDRTAHAYGVAVADDGKVLATGELGGLWMRRFSATGGTDWEISYSSAHSEPRAGLRLAIVNEDIVVLSQVLEPMKTTMLAIQLDPEGREVWRTELAPDGGAGGWWSLAMSPPGRVWVTGTSGPEAFLSSFSLGGPDVMRVTLAEGLRASALGVVLLSDGILAVTGADDLEAGWIQTRTTVGETIWRWDTNLRLNDLAVDPAGNLVACGLAHSDTDRGAVVKLTPDGTPLWTFEAPDAADGSHVERYNAVATDALGFIYAGGYTDSRQGKITKLAP